MEFSRWQPGVIWSLCRDLNYFPPGLCTPCALSCCLWLFPHRWGRELSRRLDTDTEERTTYSLNRCFGPRNPWDKWPAIAARLGLLSTQPFALLLFLTSLRFGGKWSWVPNPDVGPSLAELLCSPRENGAQCLPVRILMTWPQSGESPQHCVHSGCSVSLLSFHFVHCTAEGTEFFYTLETTWFYLLLLFWYVTFLNGMFCHA